MSLGNSLKYVYDYYETWENEVYNEIDTAVKSTMKRAIWCKPRIFLSHPNFEKAISLLLKMLEAEWIRVSLLIKLFLMSP